MYKTQCDLISDARIVRSQHWSINKTKRRTCVRSKNSNRFRVAKLSKSIYICVGHFYWSYSIINVDALFFLSLFLCSLHFNWNKWEFFPLTIFGVFSMFSFFFILQKIYVHICHETNIAARLEFSLCYFCSSNGNPFRMLNIWGARGVLFRYWRITETYVRELRQVSNNIQIE